MDHTPSSIPDQKLSAIFNRYWSWRGPLAEVYEADALGNLTLSYGDDRVIFDPILGSKVEPESMRPPAPELLRALEKRLGPLAPHECYSPGQPMLDQKRDNPEIYCRTTVYEHVKTMGILRHVINRWPERAPWPSNKKEWWAHFLRRLHELFPDFAPHFSARPGRLPPVTEEELTDTSGITVAQIPLDELPRRLYPLLDEAFSCLRPLIPGRFEIVRLHVDPNYGYLRMYLIEPQPPGLVPSKLPLNAKLRTLGEYDLGEKSGFSDPFIKVFDAFQRVRNYSARLPGGEIIRKHPDRQAFMKTVALHIGEAFLTYCCALPTDSRPAWVRVSHEEYILLQSRLVDGVYEASIPEWEE